MDTVPQPDSTGTPSKKITIGLIGLLLLLLGGFFLYQKNLLPFLKKTTPSVTITSKAPVGPFYMILGTVTEVKNRDNKFTVSLRTDWGQNYSVELNDTTKLLLIEPPKGVGNNSKNTSNITFREIKKDQQINLTSTVDLSKTAQISGSEIKIVEVYVR